LSYRFPLTSLPASADAAVGVVASLKKAGHQAYLVGGAVRDLLGGRTPGDWDVVTDALPAQIVDIYPGSKLVGAAFGVVLVPSEGTWIETATFREEGRYLDGRRPDEVRFTDDPERDALRRDFTINAVYLDPIDGAVLDPVGGISDIEANVLRAVGDPDRRFAEDGLRLLRAARLASQCSVEIEVKTLDALARNSGMVDHLAAERIAEELTRIVRGPAPARAFEVLRSTGLLRRFLPEVDALHGVEQPTDHHPEGCVWTHTMLMLEAAESPSPELALAVLLHDVAKPKTRTLRDGRPRFFGHAAESARMADAILTRLKFSNRLIGVVTSLVGRHMMFLDVENMRRSTLKRFLAHPHTDLLLALHRLDRLAGNGDLSAWEFCREKLNEFSAEDLHPEPLLGGRDLIRLGYPRGPLLSVILEELETAQLEGEITDRDAALAWVRTQHPRAD